MKKLFLLLLLLIPLTVSGLPSEKAATQMRWAAPTQNTDGTDLTDLSGFKIYWRQSVVETYSDARSITVNDPNALTYQMANMGLTTDGMYLVVITAFNSSGAESGFSNEGNFIIRDSLFYTSVVDGTVPGVPRSLVLE